MSEENQQIEEIVDDSVVETTPTETVQEDISYKEIKKEWDYKIRSR